MLRNPILIYDEKYINHDFVKEPRFVRAYNQGYKTLQYLGERGNNFIYDLWRVYTICWAANHASKLAGDFVECGVNTGFLARAVIEYIDFSSKKDKTFYLIDTFQGVPDYQFTETERKLKLDIQSRNWYGIDIYEQVKKTFQEFSNVSVIKGEVPSVLTQIPTKAVCYLSIDMNCAYPEVAAIDYFYDKIVPAGIVIFDDYGFSANNQGHITQKRALDEWASKKGLQILSLPTGQGMLIKPGNSSPTDDEVIIF